ncbi:unnamed protein product [Soboliphyme baturini]|uniref:WD_REPEATS_REGION domain-containing protein n=1 Tax=Soboliphyme baturini TaxID=241478 RepID=A0A183IU36_9BILA|nr:unnamed protein product [Soboliphyme baturini]
MSVGHPCHVKPRGMIARALVVPAFGTIAFRSVQKDKYIALAVSKLFDAPERRLVEGAGAVGLAALFEYSVPELQHKRVVVVITGRNLCAASTLRLCLRSYFRERELFAILDIVFRHEEEADCWKKACVEAEQQQRWTADEEEFRECLTLHQGHTEGVDCVHLMRDASLCVSGARDRSLCIWNLSSSGSNDTPMVIKNAAHNGWIWTISSQENRVFTGSFDSTIHAWELQQSDIVLYSNICFDSPVMSLASCPNIVYAATYNSCVNVCDMRCTLNPMRSLKLHTGTAFSIATSDNYLYSTGADSSVACVDLRTFAVQSRCSIGRNGVKLSYHKGHIFVGTSSGSLYLMNSPPRSPGLSVVKVGL